MLALIVGAIMIVGGVAQARVRRRPALEADADRLHERARADDPRRAAAEAVRVLGRRRRADRRGARRSSTGSPPGEAVGAAVGVGVGQPGADPGPRGAGCRGSPACSSRSSSRSPRRRRFDLADHGVSLVGTLPQGFPPLTLPAARCSDLPLLVAGALGIALVVADRHDLDGVGVRRAHRPGGRRQRRDDRHRRRQRRRRASSRASRSAPAARAPRSPSRRAPRRR